MAIFSRMIKNVANGGNGTLYFEFKEEDRFDLARVRSQGLIGIDARKKGYNDGINTAKDRVKELRDGVGSTDENVL